MPAEADPAPRILDLAPYRLAIQERICTFCLDHRHDGTCARPKDQPCAVNTHLAELVHIVLSTDRRSDVEGFVAKLRTDLCPTCNQDDEGHCPRRELAHCAVDSYILPIIDVIEDVAVAQGAM